MLANTRPNGRVSITMLQKSYHSRMEFPELITLLLNGLEIRDALWTPPARVCN